jgi:hypothetical protein
MRKRNLFFVPLFLLSMILQAQDRVGCNQLLEDAREAYSAGMVELVPELLLPCLESGLTGTAKQEAYKLVINAYLFDYLPEQADSLMHDFLDEFPDYQAMASDPAEFVLLLRSRQQDAESEEIITREESDRVTPPVIPEREKPQEKEPVKPRERKSAKLGFAVGINGTIPSLMEPYSMGVPLVDQGRFSMGGAGFQAGVAACFPLGRVPELSLELYYNRTRFNYSADPFEFTGYEAREYQNRLQLPVSILLNLNPEGRALFFIRAGIMVDYLLDASVSATRTYSGTGSSVLRDVVLENQDITGARFRMNFAGQLGAGLKVPLQAGSIFFETRFQPGFSRINEQDGRYGLGDLTWLIYHVDSDFRIHQLCILAGMTWDL